MRRLRTLQLATVVALFCAGRPASAEETALSWNEDWARFRSWEYVATGASLGLSFALRFAAPRDEEPNWTSDVAFDFGAQDAIAVRTQSRRDAWVVAGDIPFYGLMIYPVVDAIAVAGAGWGRWDVGWQMLMIDLEAYAVAAPLLWVTQHFVRRERPYARVLCDDPQFGPDYEPGCEDQDQLSRSFPGGHGAIVTTGAALTCLHHGKLPLYGGGAGDAAACGAAIGAAGVTIAARLATDKHYVSDMIAGVGIGVLSGYVVPSALHFGFGRTSSTSSGRKPTSGRGGPALPPPRISIGPGPGLSVSGTLW